MRKLILLFLIFFKVESKDLGVFGETFEIYEKDLLEHIFSRLNTLQESGELETEQKKVTERVKEMILHPQPITEITKAEIKREYQFDPTITVTRDLLDHRGQIFAKKGEQFNPLDRVSFSKDLLFIDGDDEEQVQWVISKVESNNSSKVILVQGSPLEVGKRLNREVYFDQHGCLTSKFGINHVPAIVFQKRGEKVLTIIEETGGKYGFKHETK